jgi:hypothetical protein
MRFPEKLKEALKELEQERDLKGLNIEVQPSGGGRFIAIVRSPSFEEIPEHFRQDLVWEKILEKLNDYEQRLVEYVHTPAPSEEEAESPPAPKHKHSTKRR